MDRDNFKSHRFRLCVRAPAPLHYGEYRLQISLQGTCYLCVLYTVVQQQTTSNKRADSHGKPCRDLSAHLVDVARLYYRMIRNRTYTASDELPRKSSREPGERKRRPMLLCTTKKNIFARLPHTLEDVGSNIYPRERTYVLPCASYTSTVVLSTGRPGGVSGYPRAWYRSVS